MIYSLVEACFLILLLYSENDLDDNEEIYDKVYQEDDEEIYEDLCSRKKHRESRVSTDQAIFKNRKLVKNRMLLFITFLGR